MASERQSDRCIARRRAVESKGCSIDDLGISDRTAETEEERERPRETEPERERESDASTMTSTVRSLLLPLLACLLAGGCCTTGVGAEATIEDVDAAQLAALVADQDYVAVLWCE